MASYIGKVQINGASETLVGSTLYGICNTSAANAAKTVGSTDTTSTEFINTNYDRLIRGTTIHVKFNQGNTATSGVTLAVGTTLAKTVVGIHECAAGTILSFTLDEGDNWVANDNIDTNTEYVFKTPYNATTNQVVGTADIGTAAEKDTVNSLADADHNTTNNNIPTATAVVNYVLDKTAGLSGLRGAMHFRGSVNSLPDATASSTYTAYDSGDVVLGPNDKEYVYYKGDNAASSQWIELGDEGSYVLQTSQTTGSAIGSVTFNQGTLPSLAISNTEVLTGVSLQPSTTDAVTTQQITIPNITNVGNTIQAQVDQGVLTISISTPTQGENITVNSVDSIQKIPQLATPTKVNLQNQFTWEDGDLPTLSAPPITVVIPAPAP